MGGRWSVAAALLLATTLPAAAQTKLDGFFVATRACPALSSLKTRANPGAVRVEAGRAYRLKGVDGGEASHYLVTLEGAVPSDRWVAIGCGQRTVDAPPAPAADRPAASADQPRVAADDRSDDDEADAADRDDAPNGKSPNGNSRNDKSRNDSGSADRSGRDRRGRTALVLAASWQPAFCEGSAGQRAPECRNQPADRFDASHFSLHGLWPQPRRNAWCRVDQDVVDTDKAGRWRQLPALELSAETRAELARVMPGTASALDRHEWTRHGTCYEEDGRRADAEAYFADSLALMRVLNASPVRDLFAAHIGRELSVEAVREAFDQAFGPGAGERVRMACRRDGNRQIIEELTIGLTGSVEADDLDATGFGRLLASAGPTRPGCPAGIVDAVGLQ